MEVSKLVFDAMALAAQNQDPGLALAVGKLMAAKEAADATTSVYEGLTEYVSMKVRPRADVDPDAPLNAEQTEAAYERARNGGPVSILDGEALDRAHPFWRLERRRDREAEANGQSSSIPTLEEARKWVASPTTTWTAKVQAAAAKLTPELLLQVVMHFDELFLRARATDGPDEYGAILDMDDYPEWDEDAVANLHAGWIYGVVEALSIPADVLAVIAAESTKLGIPTDGASPTGMDEG